MIRPFSCLMGLGLALSAIPAFADVSVNAGIGVGQFQDIQIPINTLAGQRGDGKIIDEENAEHLGLPLNVIVGYGQDHVNWQADVAFDATVMRATTGPAATQSASYSRYELHSDYRRRFVSFGRMLSVGPRLGLRRSSFANVSSAHFVDALIVGGGIGGLSQAFIWDVRLATAAAARFGYTESGTFGGKAFEKSKTSIYEIAAVTGFHLDKNVWLDLSMTREMIRTTIDDISEYDGFGLSVGSLSSKSSRSYDLATTTLQMGVRKEF